MENIEQIELNAILYYADFLSLKYSCTTVTDNCKYFFIHGVPINCAYIANYQPFFSKQNKYFKQAQEEFYMIKNKYGKEGILSFLGDIANLKAAGCVDAEQMIRYVHYYNGKFERNYALKKYRKWINTQTYTHLQSNEKGELQRVPCDRYVAHAEIGTSLEPTVEYSYKNGKG